MDGPTSLYDEWREFRLLEDDEAPDMLEHPFGPLEKRGGDPAAVPVMDLALWGYTFLFCLGSTASEMNLLRYRLSLSTCRVRASRRIKSMVDVERMHAQQGKPQTVFYDATFRVFIVLRDQRTRDTFITL